MNTRIAQKLVLIASILFSPSAFSYKIDVFVAKYRDCGYYSTTNASTIIDYYNSDLPKSSKVEVIYGFTKKGFSSGNWNSDWNRTSSDFAELITHEDGSFYWKYQIDSIIHSRGSSYKYAGLDFVLKVTLPNGEVFYEKGNDSNLGYYHASFDNIEAVCGLSPDFYHWVDIKTVVKYD